MARVVAARGAGGEAGGMRAGDLESLEQLVREQQVAVDEVLRLLMDGLKERFSADRATLYLLDQARNLLISRVAHPPELEIRLRVGEGLAGWVAANGRGVNMPTGGRDPRFNPEIDRATGYRTRTLLAEPIREAGGQLVGVVQLLNRQGGDFSAEDAAELAALCPRVAALLSTTLGAQLGPGQAEPLFFGFSGIVGQSAAMLEVYARTRRAAQTETTVLIRGQSGTGKELIARAIHGNSARRGGPFVKVDCAALPETLVENELFGHERGAFTGADRTRAGKVQEAQRGTLFIDEIGELPLPAQGRLLRLLQDRSFLMVGGTRPVEADVRFVFATHRSLQGLVAEGRFRADLYYRLRVIEIQLPSLQERGAAEIDRLTEHFLFTLGRRHGRQLRLSPEARLKLHRWPWPGNVREMEHALESAVVLAPGAVITAELLDLGEAPEARAPGIPGLAGRAHDTLPPLPLEATEDAAGIGLPEFRSPIVPLDQMELAYIRHVLTACHGNRSAAARALGIGRNTLLRKLQEGE